MTSTRVPGPNASATSLAEVSLGSVVQTSARRTEALPGALPELPPTNPAASTFSRVWLARPAREPALKTLTWTSLRLMNFCSSFSVAEQLGSAEESPPGSGARADRKP